jgi:nitrilase
VRIGGFKLAILVCEDAWHGSLSYVAALRGTDVIVHPAASAHAAIDGEFDSEDGWTTICRAEAIHYGSYVLFVNQTGGDERSWFWGGTQAIAPAGRVLTRADEGEQLVIVELHRDAIRRGRALLPMMTFENVELVHGEVRRALRARTAHAQSLPQP